MYMPVFKVRVSQIIAGFTVNKSIWEIVHYNFTKNHIHHQIIFMELKVNTLSRSQSGHHNAKLNITGIYSFA